MASSRASTVRGFAEDAFVGRKLRIGAKVVVAVTDRDPRCKMVTLNPDAAERSPEVLRAINSGHANKAGVYGAVLVEDIVRPDDEIVVADWPGLDRSADTGTCLLAGMGAVRRRPCP